MNNSASILLLILLAITFLISVYEKTFHWKETMLWLNDYFEKTILKKQVPLAVGILIIIELIAGILCVIGCFQLYLNNDKIFGFYGAVFSCISLLLMLIGQRLAKDFDGARNIVIYYIPAVLAVYWLS